MGSLLWPWLPSSVAFLKCIDLSGSQGVAGVSPFKGPSLPVIGLDKAHEPLDQFLSRFEDATAHHLAGQNAEPNLDLVQPAGMSRGEGQVKPLLFGHPGQGFLAAMGGPVVSDEVKFLFRIGGQEPAQEADEGRAVVAADRFRPDLSAMDL